MITPSLSLIYECLNSEQKTFFDNFQSLLDHSQCGHFKEMSSCCTILRLFQPSKIRYIVCYIILIIRMTSLDLIHIPREDTCKLQCQNYPKGMWNMYYKSHIS